MNIQTGDALQGVRATLSYLLTSAEKPFAYTFTPPLGVPWRSGEVNSIPNILIRNARPIADQLSLDIEGFELRRHVSAVTDFYNEDEIRSVYYGEVEQLLKEATGAQKVVIFDHTIRSIPKLREGVKGVREPAHRVHNDYTEKSGRRRVTDHLSSLEAEERLKHRYAEVNVWRAIRAPLEDSPLALCDARSLSPQDFIPTDLIYRDKIGETYSFSFNPNHRWFYFPKLRADEAILIKCFDSKADGRARITAHTAFDDPTKPRDALERESIEVRSLLFFPPET